MRELYLLTGEIRSGKTTTLLKWSEKRSDVYGILTPIAAGKRMFMDVHTKERFEMEASDPNGSFLEVGNYKFNKASFKKAGQILSLSKQSQGWLIVDEIGPLELKGDGFYKVVVELLQCTNHELNLLFVIRHSILEKVIDHFQLQGFSPNLITTQSEFFS